MDTGKLKKSCVCGNTLPYLECCGLFGEDHAGRRPESEDVYRGFRRSLHELSMALFSFRDLYRNYWEKLAKEGYPHDLLMEDPDYGRAVVENFFWDYSTQYSDARPMLRAARDLETKDLRLAHDLMQWSLAPLWFYRVEGRSATEATLRNLGNGRTHTVIHAGRLPRTGSGVLTRVLSFRGRDFHGHTVLPFDAPEGGPRLETLFRAACRKLGVKGETGLRPDVHCEAWREHGAVFLDSWRSVAYDAEVGRPARTPAAARTFAIPSGKRAALARALSASPGFKTLQPGAWELRFRSLRTARLKMEGGGLSVTPADAAFEDFVTRRLRGLPGLGDAEFSDPGGNSLGGAAGIGFGSRGEAWLRAPLSELNGQNPLQAAAHDWGRQRLRSLLEGLRGQGWDAVALRQRLGI